MLAAMGHITTNDAAPEEGVRSIKITREHLHYSLIQQLFQMPSHKLQSHDPATRLYLPGNCT